MAEYDIDLGRLCQAASRSYLDMKPFREERVKGIRALAGERYSTNAAGKKVYVNLISLYVNIISRNLIAKNPRVMLNTDDRASLPVVDAMQTWANEEIERMNLSDTIKRVVIDALFAVGICKIGLATPSDAMTMAWNLKAGHPFVMSVDLDDFVYDMNARNFDEVAFIGHKYRAVKRSIEDSDLYDKRVRKNLATSEFSRYNNFGDEKAQSISRTNTYGSEGDFEDMVDLWEIYVPRHRCVYTFTDDQFSGPAADQAAGETIPLRKQKWIGPDSGPYHILSFQTIPGNSFPKGPVQDLLNLDEAANNVLRKLVRQSHDLKQLTLFRSGDDGDAERIRKAQDNSLVPITGDPKNFVPMVTGGPNQGLFVIMREFISRFMEQGGNLATVGGLAPQAGTLGQEQLLASQSNGQVAGMQDATTTFVSKSIESLNWYWWHDPQRVMSSKYEVEGVPEVWIKRQVHPWDHSDPSALKRSGPMPKIKVDPYSMRHTTPQQRADDIIKFVTRIYAPLAQSFEKQGVALDLNEVLAIVGKYWDMPELKRIFATQDSQSAPEEQGEPQQPGMPPETTRNYVRRSLGGNSAQAQGASLDNALQGGMKEDFAKQMQ